MPPSADNSQVGMSGCRVLFVDQTGELGGGELALLDVIGHWSGRCEVVLFTDGPLRVRLEQAGLEVRVLSAGSRMSSYRRSGNLWSALLSLPGTIRLLRETSRRMRFIDVVYANSMKAFVIATVAATLARRPIVWHLHDILTASHFSRINRRGVVWLANRFARCVVVNSAATAAAFRVAGGAAEVFVAHNGIDPAPFAGVDATAARRALAEEIRCGGAPIVGVFGRLATWKGQRVAIQALQRLPGIHLVLVGAALFDEHQYETELRVIASQAGVSKRVHFLGFRDDVAKLMRAVDAILHTSIAPEPFGRVIVEGMLAGKPVVATAAGGPLEIIEDGVSGLLVPPGNVEALANAVTALLDDPDRVRMLSERAREVATARFTLSASINVMEQAVAFAIPRRTMVATSAPKICRQRPRRLHRLNRL